MVMMRLWLNDHRCWRRSMGNKRRFVVADFRLNIDRRCLTLALMLKELVAITVGPKFVIPLPLDFLAGRNVASLTCPVHAVNPASLLITEFALGVHPPQEFLATAFHPKFVIPLALDFLTGVAIALFAFPVKMVDTAGFLLTMLALPVGPSQELLAILGTGWW